MQMAKTSQENVEEFSFSRLVLLWVRTGPHVLQRGPCSPWVSLRSRQGLRAAGRVLPGGERAERSGPCGRGLSLPAPLSLLCSPHLSPVPLAGLAAFTSASLFSLSLTHLFTGTGFLPFAAALPSATASRSFPPPILSVFSTSLPGPLAPRPRCPFTRQDGPRATSRWSSSSTAKQGRWALVLQLPSPLTPPGTSR